MSSTDEDVEKKRVKKLRHDLRRPRPVYYNSVVGSRNTTNSILGTLFVKVLPEPKIPHRLMADRQQFAKIRARPFRSYGCNALRFLAMVAPGPQSYFQAWHHIIGEKQPNAGVACAWL